MYIQQDKLRREDTERMIIEAEKGKAQILKPPGNKIDFEHNCNNSELTTTEMDDHFFHSSAHIDKALKDKIRKWNLLIW